MQQLNISILSNFAALGSLKYVCTEIHPLFLTVQAVQPIQAFIYMGYSLYRFCFGNGTSGTEINKYG